MARAVQKSTQHFQSAKDPRRASVAVLFHRIGPYHFARLRAAGRLLAIRAIELSGVDQHYAWDPIEGTDNFERQTVFAQADSHTQPAGEVARRVRAALDQHPPSVVVLNGWSDTGALSALEWCLRTRSPAVIMSESTAFDEARSSWKEWIKRRIVRLCAAGLVGGAPHAEYLISLGIPRERIFTGYDAVDNDYFSSKADDARTRACELRRRHNLPECYFLASARFIAKKNLATLLNAYARYRQLASSPSSAAWPLVLLGDGPLKSVLAAQLSALRLRDHARMPGFIQYPDLPIYYGLAGAFVHASVTEQWGLVVNEAMAAGLPVLVSNRCGCVPDLVREDVNGFSFDPLDSEQLSKLMLKVSAVNFPRAAFGKASRDIISFWGPDRFATGLKAAVEAAFAAPPPKAAILDRLALKLLLRRRLPVEN